MFLFLLLSLCVTHCRGQDDMEEWMDPTDMFNYDAAAGKMIKLKHNTEEKVEGVCEKGVEDTCLGNNHALVLGGQKSKQETEDVKHQEDLKLSECNSNPVLRRYLRKMLNEAKRFGLPEDSSSEVYYNAEMVLSKQMVVDIEKFIEGEDCNLGALEEVLIRTLVQFRFHNVKEWWTGVFEDYLGIDLGTTFKILLCVTCIITMVATEFWSRIGWFTQIKRLCIITFIVSLFWNWMYLYKVAFAERQAELAKMQKFDGSCGEKMSWSESLLEWWKGASTFQNDPCEEYFKSLMINPVLMVPPTKALALTFTDFITEPLKHVGKALGEFLNGLLAEIPVLYQLLVLIAIVAIVMVSCYGATKSVGQVLIHRNNRDTSQERLPPAAPERPYYGNNIEGRQQQIYYLEPGNGPVYINPRNRRPESLQAMDITDNRKDIYLPGFTDVDFPLEDKNWGQEPRKQESPEQSRKHTAGRREESDIGNHKKKDQLKKRSPGKRQQENEPVIERSIGQREEKPIEQMTHDSIQKITNNAIQSKTGSLHQTSFHQEQIEVEPVDQNGEHQSKEEPLHKGFSGPRQRTERSVEDISYTEQPCKGGQLDEKTLLLKGAVQGDPTDEKIYGEESSSIAKQTETSPEEQQILTHSNVQPETGFV